MISILNYKDTYKKVKEVVKSIDPIGLVSGGAPQDEYNSEINKIVSLLQKSFEVSFLAEEIYKIFVEYFGEETAGDKSIYYKIAEKIKQIF
jgi:hypothetical protein